MSGWDQRGDLSDLAMQHELDQLYHQPVDDGPDITLVRDVAAALAMIAGCVAAWLGVALLAWAVWELWT